RRHAQFFIQVCSALEEAEQHVGPLAARPQSSLKHRFRSSVTVRPKRYAAPLAPSVAKRSRGVAPGPWTTLGTGVATAAAESRECPEPSTTLGTGIPTLVAESSARLNASTTSQAKQKPPAVKGVDATWHFSLVRSHYQ